MIAISSFFQLPPFPPGKIAPVTSGAIIKDTVMNIIKEMYA